jgi:hypothetical protein
MRRTPAVLIAVTLFSCAAGPPSPRQEKFLAAESARLDLALAGKTPGKPQSCLPLRYAGGVESFGEETLLFRVSRKLVYRTETRGSCRGAGRDRTLITKPSGSQLCRGDIAQVADFQTGFRGGSCVIGSFVPYRADAM